MPTLAVSYSAREGCEINKKKKKEEKEMRTQRGRELAREAHTLTKRQQ